MILEETLNKLYGVTDYNEYVALIKSDINEEVLSNYQMKSNEELLEYINYLFNKYNLKTNIFMLETRDAFVQIFGWSVPDSNSLKEIVSFVDKDGILEIAGGKGLWSRLFKCSGIPCKCTSIVDNNYYNEKICQQLGVM